MFLKEKKGSEKEVIALGLNLDTDNTETISPQNPLFLINLNLLQPFLVNKQQSLYQRSYSPNMNTKNINIKIPCHYSLKTGLDGHLKAEIEWTPTSIFLRNSGNA